MSLKIRLLFDETHNEGGRLNSTFTILYKILEQNQMESISLIDFPITIDKIKKYDIFIIAGPDMSKFRITEINDIISYVKDGGKLIVMSDAGGDSGHMTNLNKLVSYFGVQFNADQVIDTNSNLGIDTVPIIDKLLDHVIFEGIQSISYKTGCSLSVKGNVEILAKSNQTSEPPNSALITISNFGAGTVICIGTYEIFRDIGLGGIKTQNHQNLFLNICDFLLTSDQKTAEVKVEDIKEEIVSPLTTELKLIREVNSVNTEKSKAGSKIIEEVEIKPIVKTGKSSELLSKFDNLEQSIANMLNSMKEHLYSNSELQEKLNTLEKEINSTIKKLSDSGLEKLPNYIKDNKKAIENLIPRINENLQEIKKIGEQLNSLSTEIIKSNDLLQKKISNIGDQTQKNQKQTLDALNQKVQKPLEELQTNLISSFDKVTLKINKDTDKSLNNFEKKIITSISDLDAKISEKIETKISELKTEINDSILKISNISDKNIAGLKNQIGKLTEIIEKPKDEQEKTAKTKSPSKKSTKKRISKT